MRLLRSFSAALVPVFVSLSALFGAFPAAAQTNSSRRLALRSGWQLQSGCKVDPSGEEISEPRFDARSWHRTNVPSTVVAALVADGTYPDPDFGMNLRQIPGTSYPIGANFVHLPMPAGSPFACAWWYRTEFEVPESFAGKTLWLHFNGVNYRANIWLNGRKLADADDVAGSYRIFEFDATKFLKPGQKNVLAAEVFAPTENDLAMNWVDWNPAPPDKDMGLWGDVYIRATGRVELRYPAVFTHFTDPSLREADLTIVAEAQNASSSAVTATVDASFDSVRVEKQIWLQPGELRTVMFTPAQFPQLRIAHPKIWWPYGLGLQTLHRLIMRAIVNSAVSDERQTRFGIREITSELTPQHYRLFRINGRRILIRGGGWSPDMLMRDSPQRLEAQFDYVRELGLNTIRLEGKLEPEDFFNLADERGVLVVAGWCCCSIWEEWNKWTPRDLEIATAQLRSQILRLRSHPSLLVWLNGSDNPPPAEVERAYLQVENQAHWPNPILSSASQKPTAVSGISGVKMTGPYAYVPPAYWLEDKTHGGAYGFNTETSPGAAPVVEESLRKMMPASEIWPANEYWHFHSGSGAFQHLTTFDDAMAQIYGAAANLGDYERKAQAMAYEGERAMFEAYARNKFTSTGVIQWMLNNAWPSLFWHLYDYYLQPAGGYFGAKKANELLHIQYSYDDRSVAVANSLYRPVTSLTVSADVYNFELKPIFTRKETVSIPANATEKVFALPAPTPANPPQTYFVKLNLRDASGKLLSSNFYWLSTKPPVFEPYWSTYVRTEEYSYADLGMLANLAAVQLEASARREHEPSGDGVRVEIENPSRNLAFQVRLEISSKDGREILPVFWDDNYFELLPGESRTLSARYPSWIHLAANAQLHVGGWNITPLTIPIAAETQTRSTARPAN